VWRTSFESWNLRERLTFALLGALVLFCDSCTSGGGGSSGTSASASCSLTNSTLGSTGIQVYPGPGGGAYQSSLYTVSVYDGSAWQSSYTYTYNRTAKTAWHRNANPSVNFTTFAATTSAQVKVGLITGNVTSLAVYPSRYNITPIISAGVATFNLSQNQKVWLVVNYDDSNPLFVFADPPKPNLPTSCNLKYFGPGVTTINQYQAVSNQVFYLDGGAVVRGNINVAGTTGVQIVGPGILSGDLWTAETVQSYTFSQETQYAMISGDLNTNDNAKVSGITILDAPFYHFWGGASTVTGVKELSPWYWSTDGFEGVPTVSNVFAFVGDNAFFPSQAGTAGQNYTVTNSFAATTNNAIFNGGFWGRPASASFSYSATMDTIDIISFTDGRASITGTHTPAIFQIWVDNSTNNSSVGNYGNSSNGSTFGYANQTYKNIVVEDYYTTSSSHASMYSNMGELINICYPWTTSTCSTSGPNYPLGNSYNFTFQNINVKGAISYTPDAGITTGTKSLIQGLNSGNVFSNINWTNLQMNGVLVNTTNANVNTYFNINAFVNSYNFN